MQEVCAKEDGQGGLRCAYDDEAEEFLGGFGDGALALLPLLPPAGGGVRLATAAAGWGVRIERGNGERDGRTGCARLVPKDGEKHGKERRGSEEDEEQEQGQGQQQQGQQGQGKGKAGSHS